MRRDRPFPRWSLPAAASGANTRAPFELLTAEEHLVLFVRAMGLSRKDALAQGRIILNGFGSALMRCSTS